MERDIKGLRELQAALEQFPAKVERNILRGAMRAGAKEIAEEVQRRAPVADGDLRASVRARARVKHGKVLGLVSVGDKKAWYARFVEFGTAAHFIKPKARKSLFIAGLLRETVDHPGARKNPFFRTAIDAAWRRAVEAVVAYIRRRLTKAGVDLPSE